VGLYKRNDTWCIQYFANGARKREAIGPSKRQAELVLAKRKADLREGRYFTPTEKPMAFSVLADRYLKEYAALHKKPRSYLRNVASDKILKAFFGETLITNITPEQIHAFILHRKEQGKAAATINGEVAHLSHLFTWANKLKLTTQHPVKGVSKLRANRRERYLTHEEIQHFLRSLRADRHCSISFAGKTCESLAATRSDLHDIVVIALGTGMRATEVLGLDRDHVNLKQGVAVLEDTKNHDRRVIPLPLPVVEIFQQRPVPLREWFPGWNLPMLTQSMRRATKRAGVQGVTFHTLRHTFASHAVMNGVDLYTLATILGHRDLSMVKRYAHLSAAHLQGATERVATAIFAADMPRQVPQISQPLRKLA